ncbi:helix-turn-helix transcriptional regulator [Deinococcus sp. HMF7604]|uniref:helix-turn-helix domain-containing protein n=1 Tax=Deinococcus betulae TaxID=2873312 RepID=UPI001CCBC78B|nr:helix-turn-helix transcriptional regulator [Deinococcus betulae]
MSASTAHTERLRAIGLRLQAARLRLGLNQDDFADRAGVHRSYVGMLENGKKDLRLSMLYRLAEATELTVAELLGFNAAEEAGTEGTDGHSSRRQ